ncbi:hypothetical protein A7U60_g4184 [Sanghuangporus baumii]|uniref:3'-5' exonuclease domain-containing protein n=1 Tax=Sanghuangporus baumii TaxID=108892 RepID=A0A9Q5HZF5_SANBA|nr:hypothetical protein A7U60_g4184 [Sanghuangporus baumii]
MFTLCTTAESISLALEKLLDAEYVFLDCEGRDLGCAPGALSLISIGTPHAAEVYLFDVLALPQDSLQLLFNSILSLTPSARAKTKVVWDGRMDYVELFYSHSCPIENVLDLQLIDVLSRAKRGETEHRRLCRFVRRTFPMSEVRKLQLEEVYVLNGMDDAMREHKIDGVEMKNGKFPKLLIIPEFYSSMSIGYIQHLSKSFTQTIYPRYGCSVLFRTNFLIMQPAISNA